MLDKVAYEREAAGLELTYVSRSFTGGEHEMKVLDQVSYRVSFAKNRPYN